MTTINVQSWSPNRECCINVLTANGFERTRAEQIVDNASAYIQVDDAGAALSVMQGLSGCGCLVHLIGLTMGVAGSMKNATAAKAKARPAKKRGR